MASNYKIKKGLNIPINGSSEPVISQQINSKYYAVKPGDFRGIIPRLSIAEGERVLVGSAIFHDKNNPQIVFCSPVSGTIEAIIRGEKRKLEAIIIKADSTLEYLKFNTSSLEKMSSEEIKLALIESGLWACIKERPFGIVPKIDSSPKAIFASFFDSSPLAPDLDLTLSEEKENIQTGINALKKIFDVPFNIGLESRQLNASIFNDLKNVNIHRFSGPHPAGNVGIQIHHINPINKGEVVWTIKPQHLAAIGKLFNQQIYDMSCTIALCGPRVSKPCYFKTISGICLDSISSHIGSDYDKLHDNCPIRYISGNILTGTRVQQDGFLGFFDNQITLITEGNYYELFGWAKPFRPKKFSASRSYFSWLFPKKKYNVDSNLNGGERAFVFNDAYSKVLPMDILPTYLFKSIIAENIDMMEKLGIYEVIEEDVALCEYICPSKIEIQSIVSKGIDLMIKELE